ncbi:hypothetical protein DXG01_011199 [Tephrocybe rancida]|nr:hypothetical protein DXG01_011199 [Tephrocybe rancida]
MNGKGANGRPAHLMLSPSDGALKASAMAVGVDNIPEEEEDRGVACEVRFPPPLPPSDSDAHDINLKSEAVHSTSMCCRLFGRSYDSASRHSKKGSVSASASPVPAEYKKDKNDGKDKGDKEKEKDRDSLGSLRPRSKKSTDSTGKGAGERLSIFGSTFSGTLGKGRKPPPRYPANTHQEALALPRLTSNSRKTSGHDRPPSASTTGTATPKSTPKPTPKSAYKEAPVGSTSSQGPTLLRKRTSSAPAPPTDARLLSLLKQGQSILEQIGDMDFKGWMRKKGDSTPMSIHPAQTYNLIDNAEEEDELLLMQAAVFLVILIGIEEVHQDRIRHCHHHRLYLRCAELLPNPRAGTPWQILWASQNDRAFITMMGFDVETFRYILKGFAQRWDTTPIPREDVPSNSEPHPERQSLDACGALGLTLHYLGSSMLEIHLQQIFALVPSTVSRYLIFSLKILHETLAGIEEARISMPQTREEFEFNSDLICERHLLLEGAFGGLDGLSLAVQESDDPEIENATYNGWKSAHCINNVLAFGPDGVSAVISKPRS